MQRIQSGLRPRCNGSRGCGSVRRAVAATLHGGIWYPPSCVLPILCPTHPVSNPSPVLFILCSTVANRTASDNPTRKRGRGCRRPPAAAAGAERRRPACDSESEPTARMTWRPAGRNPEPDAADGSDKGGLEVTRILDRNPARIRLGQ
jgi:hypothetical protein